MASDFQAQLNDLKSEQLEQDIEQNAQARILTEHGKQIEAITSLGNAFWWTVLAVGFFIGFLTGIALDEWAAWAGWFGRSCYWGVPCGQ